MTEGSGGVVSEKWTFIGILNGIQEVRGSIPLRSTKFNKDKGFEDLFHLIPKPFLLYGIKHSIKPVIISDLVAMTRPS